MSAESEIAVLGSCLCSEAALNAALAVLKEEHFSDPRNQLLFKRMVELRGERIPVDPVTVMETLGKDLEKVGGRAYLLEIAEKVPSALHVEHYAGLVRRDYFYRELVKTHQLAVADPAEPKHRARLRELWQGLMEQKGRMRDLDKGLMEYLEIIAERGKTGSQGFLSGYAGIDNMTGGFHPGQLCVVGARTSRGKTTFLLCLADRFMMRGRKVLFYSAEMGFIELVDRILAARTKIPLMRIRGKMDELDHKRLTEAASEIYQKPLVVDDIGRLAIASIRAGIEAVKPDIVMVDYIQRFQVPGGGNRAAFFSDVANELKSIAREKKVLVFASSQINRSVQEGGKEREPNLSDLKESGGIEEASDIVLLLHTKSKPDGSPQQDFDFIFAKQRNGPLGRVKFLFLKNTVSFEEMTDEEETGAAAG